MFSLVSRKFLAMRNIALYSVYSTILGQMRHQGTMIKSMFRVLGIYNFDLWEKQDYPLTFFLNLAFPFALLTI